LQIPLASLLVRPTGLADGLALEEQRYELGERSIRPIEDRLSTDSEWFPRSPLAVAGGDSAGTDWRGSINTNPGRACPAGEPPQTVVASGVHLPHYDAGRLLGGHSVMKTYVATPATRERNWLVVDATGKTLGRLATQIADALRGKRKPEYTPHVDVGDFVIVVNAEKISVTGNKREEKRYYRHSGYPGGLRSRTLEEMLERRPEEVIRLAVKGMLPRNRLGRAQLRKLKIYAGPDHPHAAQKPERMELVA
jgi:large subunit ribosomal protein L13